jgi:hypothetical protein
MAKCLFLQTISDCTRLSRERAVVGNNGRFCFVAEAHGESHLRKILLARVWKKILRGHSSNLGIFRDLLDNP